MCVEKISAEIDEVARKYSNSLKFNRSVIDNKKNLNFYIQI